MIIYELTYPGTGIAIENFIEVRKLLFLIESEFTEAVLALNFFDIDKIRVDHFSKEKWCKDKKRRKQLTQKFEKLYDHQDFEFDKDEEISNLVDIEMKREKWDAGDLPLSYEIASNLMYAKAFLNNLATIGRLLKVLSITKGVPNDIDKISKDFYVFFPELREVRNSAQHIEDRGRGLGAGRNPKPLDLKPVDNRVIKANGGALILNQLIGNKYGNTMSDGHYGEVEVSECSLKFVQGCIQTILDSFTWEGAQQHYPQ